MTQNKTMTVDSILYGTYGYDQTNAVFYKVVKRTAKTVTVTAIGKEAEYA